MPTEEPMRALARRADAAPLLAARAAAVVRAARPAVGLASVVLVEVLASPRARAAAAGLARALGRRLAAGAWGSASPETASPPARAWWTVTVDERRAPSLLVRRVETALVVRRPGPHSNSGGGT
jgi:hypothetical protein